jgi:hypothetical protein
MPQPIQNDSPAFGITSMVTGIVALVLVWIPLINFALSTIAIIFGVLGLRKPASKGMAIAGLATGSVAMLITLIIGLFWLVVIIGSASEY